VGLASEAATLESRVDHVEQRIIEEALRRHNNHRTATARELGISRVTLYNKMKKFGMLKA
jgi:transcriptional regulator with PAS, ATPase and Fis domain